MKRLFYEFLMSLYPELNGIGQIASNPAHNYKPERPFVDIRYRGTFTSPAVDHNGGVVGVEVWFHDDYADYERWINPALLKLRRRLSKNETPLPLVGSGGVFLAEASWDSDSPDLTDDGYQTICRMSSYTLVGKE